MTTEELLLAKWRNLPPDKQQEALAFVDRLSRPHTDSPLGQKLRAIRSISSANGRSSAAKIGFAVKIFWNLPKLFMPRDQETLLLTMLAPLLSN